MGKIKNKKTLQRKASSERDGWDDLAAAVIMQGVKDYRYLKKHPESSISIWRQEFGETLPTIKGFFESEWFEQLCAITGYELSGGKVLEALDENINEPIRIENGLRRPKK